MALRALRTRAQAVAAAPQEAELAALKQKEKLPWGQLSVQEKTSLYRAAYGQSRAELMAGEQDGGKVAVGVLVGIGASYLLFAGLQSLAAPQPKTMSKEWKDAEKEKQKASGANPLTSA